MNRSNNTIVWVSALIALLLIGLAFYAVHYQVDSNNEINIWGITLKSTTAYVVISLLAVAFFARIASMLLKSESKMDTSSHFIYITVHEEGYKTQFISKAIVKFIVKPEPKSEMTDLNGHIKLSYSPIYEGQKAIINAEQEGYEAISDLEITLKNEIQIFIPLKKKPMLPPQ
jgi:hypothetical protein